MRNLYEYSTFNHHTLGGYLCFKCTTNPAAFQYIQNGRTRSAYIPISEEGFYGASDKAALERAFERRAETRNQALAPLLLAAFYETYTRRKVGLGR
ncbi:MAG: hypothetical protein LBG43_05170 [Treponema sp.]|nr:hypothetical protein [Treponema sp.]